MPVGFGAALVAAALPNMPPKRLPAARNADEAMPSVDTLKVDMYPLQHFRPFAFLQFYAGSTFSVGAGVEFLNS